MHEDAPPLKVWAYSAVAVFSLLFLFLSYCYSPFGPYAKVLARSNRSLADALSENNARDTSAISVVILGSSLTENAIFDSDEIERRVFNQTKRRINVLRVAIYYMDMQLAERIDFFKYISECPPNYLFIENFGLNLEFVGEGRGLPVPIEAALHNLRNQARSKIGLGTHENYFEKWYTFDTKPFPDSDFYTDQFDSITFKSLQPRRCAVRKVWQNKIANSAYDTLLKMNSKVIFLDMTQSKKLRPYFLTDSSIAKYHEVMEFYRQRYHIDYWEYPDVMNDSCFTDGVHLNYKGAMKYQEWFVSELASIK